jgi:hypothetical protein
VVVHRRQQLCGRQLRVFGRRRIDDALRQADGVALGARRRQVLAEGVAHAAAVAAQHRRRVGVWVAAAAFQAPSRKLGNRSDGAAGTCRHQAPDLPWVKNTSYFVQDSRAQRYGQGIPSISNYPGLTHDFKIAALLAK